MPRRLQKDLKLLQSLVRDYGTYILPVYPTDDDTMKLIKKVCNLYLDYWFEAKNKQFNQIHIRHHEMMHRCLNKINSIRNKLFYFKEITYERGERTLCTNKEIKKNRYRY